MKKWLTLPAIAISFFCCTGYSTAAEPDHLQPASMVDLSNKYPAYVKQSGPPGKQQVALTFDDGPDTEFTPRILDVLKENRAKATFFLIGERAEAHPDIVKRMAAEGHDIANHTFSHRRLPELAPDQFKKEITDTQNTLKRITGLDTRLFRPPYTCIAEEEVKWLADQKIYTIGWNADTQDWKQIPADLVEAKVFDQIKPGGIVVMHSTGANTAEALPRIIKRLRDQGLEPVTVSQLLGVQAYGDGNNIDGKSNGAADQATFASVEAPKVTDNVYGQPAKPTSALRLDSEEYSLGVGGKLDTSLFAVNGSQNTDVTKNSTYSIADPTIASVDSAGNITGLKRGQTVLTATYGSVNTTAKVYVY